jgi:SAM-dependent methyltransferase/uncharacterized protein YbaR (Trm112 family)
VSETVSAPTTVSAAPRPGAVRPELQAVLACPVCHGPLDFGAAITCRSCRRQYSRVNGVPRLFHPESIFGGETAAPAPSAAATTGGRAAQAMRDWLPSMTTWVDETIFRALNERCTDDMLVLNLGSGIGRFDDRIRASLRDRLIQMDVTPSPSVELLADGHFLPFADNSLDGVFSNAVLEHVQRPWIVAAEISRVLKPGGTVFISVPFLNVIHDEHDYFRFTDKALRVLFPGFTPVAAGVSAGGGSFINTFLIEYAACFVPGGPVRKGLRYVLSFVLSPTKYLDRLIGRSDHLRVTADAFYFVGVKT